MTLLANTIEALLRIIEWEASLTRHGNESHTEYYKFLVYGLTLFLGKQGIL
jgi:hypothetical protein